MLSTRLQLFPVLLGIHDAAAAAPAGDPAMAEPTPPGNSHRGKQTDGAKPVVLYGKQPEGTPPASGENKPKQPAAGAAKTPAQRQAEFSELINGEFKDEFKSHFQQTFDRRFKDNKAQGEKLDTISPLLDTLGAKYGIEDGDPAKIVAAFEADNEFFEKLADDEGMTVDQYKKMLKLTQENAKTRTQLAKAEAVQERA